MEVVAMSGNAPFKREVHEWKHIDEKTGALLSGRAEANRYVNGNINSFGKVRFFFNKIVFLVPYIFTSLIRIFCFNFCLLNLRGST
jgi:hypothetical protein